MKKSRFFFLILLVTMISCKKNGSDGLPPSYNDGTCRMLSMTNTTHTSSTAGWFYYDNSGNLLYTKSINPAGDTVLGMTYKYQGGTLQYSWFNSSSYFSDTVFYYYDGDKRISQTVEHNRVDTGLLLKTTHFYYNTSGQVIHTLALYLMNNHFSRADSAIYTYSGNNISRYTVYERTANGGVSHISVDFSYDSMKNFNKAMGMPPDMFYFWSENNILEAKYADSTSAVTTYIYSKYNEFGYPTEFTQINRYVNPDTVTVIATYQCK